MRDQLGNAERRAPRCGRCPIRSVDLGTGSGHPGSVASLSKCGRLIAVDGCNESEVVNECGVNEMHETIGQIACLPAYIIGKENVRLRVEKVHLAI